MLQNKAIKLPADLFRQKFFARIRRTHGTPSSSRLLLTNNLSPVSKAAFGGSHERYFCLCRGRCPHRPERMRRIMIIPGKSVIFYGPMWASAPTALNRMDIVRIPYVKYSMGANETTCTVCCALGKPDSAARPKGVRTTDRATTTRRTERHAFSGA